MSQPTMTVCSCSDPWCRVNGCRIANAQRYGAQINYGPAYVVPNLHAECAKREEQLRAEVERLRGERDHYRRAMEFADAEAEGLRDEADLLRTGLDATRAYADRMETEALHLRGERAAVVAYVRGLRAVAISDLVAAAIERGEHRCEEGA